MKNIFTSTQKEHHINTINYNITMARCNINIDNIQQYLNKTDVKFIFINPEYNNISSDKTINEIHQFKSKYRANANIILPITVIKPTMTKYPTHISIIYDNETQPDGYVLISKLYIRNHYKETMYQNKEYKIKIGELLCMAELDNLNNILQGNVYKIKTIKINNTTNEKQTLYDDIIFGTPITDEIINEYNQYIQESINAIIKQQTTQNNNYNIITNNSITNNIITKNEKN